MIAARARVFDAAAYAPMRDVLRHVVATTSPSSVLDLGCGEGYYTRSLCDLSKPPLRIGIDLSKKGISRAARLDPGGMYLVGNCFQPPLADDSIDTIISVFSPVPEAAIARVSRRGAYLVVAGPGPDHLIEIRKSIYREVRKQTGTTPAVPDSWQLVHEDEVHSLVEGNVATVGADIVRMSPYIWSSQSDRALDAVCRLTSITLSFRFSVYRLP
ncbi:methyltransferase domain-containing protein [Actinomyces ruminis]|uniref:Methyltransferase domain-containing protein n=1 Tax=Actinomyces ruminis TaxID=1937003 RepID=A0ABX4M9G0_9ACTO|nr:methyltransferase domain-containing protein [Actinomyces ruminis]PHP52082.1 methyltransferase domain-containing protein [Actinomyces ruminis]